MMMTIPDYKKLIRLFLDFTSILKNPNRLFLKQFYFYVQALTVPMYMVEIKTNFVGCSTRGRN